jgi:hypothetical protein
LGLLLDNLPVIAKHWLRVEYNLLGGQFIFFLSLGNPFKYVPLIFSNLDRSKSKVIIFLVFVFVTSALNVGSSVL